jgi:hypothetical protein
MQGCFVNFYFKNHKIQAVSLVGTAISGDFSEGVTPVPIPNTVVSAKGGSASGGKPIESKDTRYINYLV